MSVYLKSIVTACLLALSIVGVRAESLDFTLPDLDGKSVRLADYRGQWVVVNFWASWCGPCLREIPELVAFQRDNPQHQVLGINYELLSVDETRKFAREFKMNFPILKTGEKPKLPIGIAGLPTTLIVNPAGDMVANHMGPVTQAMLEEFIRSESANPPR